MRTPWIPCFLLFCALFTPIPVQGEAGLPTKPLSVYEVEPVRDFGITSLALAGGAFPYLFAKRWIRPSCPCDPAQVNGFDRGAIGNVSQTAIVVSDVTLLTSILGPALLDFWALGFSSELYEDMIVYTQALAISGALVSLTKHLVQRPLPRVYAGKAPELINEPEGYRSFYSGHTTLAVTALSAAAVTANLRYRAGVVPWIVAGTLGTAVSVGRILGGVHFASDVLVGAAMGTAVGTLVPLLHSRTRENRQSILLVPTPGGAQLVVMKLL